MKKRFVATIVAMMAGILLSACDENTPDASQKEAPAINIETSASEEADNSEIEAPAFSVEVSASQEMESSEIEESTSSAEIPVAPETENSETEESALLTEAPASDVPASDATDYSLRDNWCVIPEITKKVDTIFIYPTVYCNYKKDAPQYAPLHDEMMTEGAEREYQKLAGVFEESTNVFVPYYRQANITIEVEAYDRDGDLESCLEGEYPETDINAALDYYFKNYNDGRLFILAGHSQGAAMVRLILKNYFGAHPEYYKRMVVAYVIGYSITRDDLRDYPYLKFAQGESDTGVIVSWNTEGEGNKNAYNIVVMKDGVCINPINWRLDDTYASADENLGSWVKDPETGEMVSMNIGADAQLDLERGVVICHADYPFIGDGNEDAEEIFGKESFHNGDFTLFYNNFKENVAKRCDAFLGANGS